MRAKSSVFHTTNVKTDHVKKKSSSNTQSACASFMCQSCSSQRILNMCVFQIDRKLRTKQKGKSEYASLLDTIPCVQVTFGYTHQKQMSVRRTSRGLSGVCIPNETMEVHKKLQSKQVHSIHCVGYFHRSTYLFCPCSIFTFGKATCLPNGFSPFGEAEVSPPYKLLYLGLA